MKEFVLRPGAVVDLRTAYRWYEEERSGLGEEFLRSVRASIEKAVSAPQAYAVIHRETRRVLVPRFPYGLFFRVVEDTVVILACYHLRRKPSSWRRRR